MKTVGNYDFVISCWIAQDRPEARTSYVKRGMQGFEGTRMFFKGDTIYSYYDWWPVARLLPEKRALLNCNRYSVTTSRHTSMVEYALRRAEFRIFQTSGIEQSSAWLYGQYQIAYQRAQQAREGLLHQRWKGLPVITVARRAYLEFCREFDCPVEFDLTKEQWKELALRYKKYYDRRKLKQFANRLLHGKENY